MVHATWVIQNGRPRFKADEEFKPVLLYEPKEQGERYYLKVQQAKTYFRGHFEDST